MDHDELKRRIDSLDWKVIPKMSPQSMVMLTYGFKETLVRRIMAKVPIDLQQEYLGFLLKKYKAYYIIPPPSYFHTLLFDIECGIPITATDEESAPAPTNMPQEVTETDSQEPAQTKQQQEQERKLQKELAERDATIEELKERIADYESRFDPKNKKGKREAAMTGKQHVILFLSVLAEHDRIPNARTNLDSLMSFIAARNQSTMYEYLKDSITQEECEKLAKEFNAPCPFIANLIRQLPDKLKEDISKKNSAKASKKVKD